MFNSNVKKDKKRVFGLREKTVIQVGVFVIITFVAIMVVSSMFYRDTILEVTNENMLSITKSIALEIDSVNLRAITITQSIIDYQDAGGFKNRPTSEQYLRALLESNDFITGTYIGYEQNADGEDINNIGAPGHDSQGRFLPYWYRDQGRIVLDPLLDADTSEYYLGPKRNGKVSITEPFLYEGVMLVSVSAPTIVQGKFQGIAGVDIAMKDVADYLKNFKPYDTAKFYLVSSNGNYIAAPDSSIVGSSYSNDPNYNEVFSSLLSSDTGTHSDTISGNNYMYAFSTIENGGWSLIVEVDESEVLLPVNKITTLLIGLVSLGVLIILLLIFITISKALKPIKSIIVGIEKLSSGDFSTPIKQASRDEIGDIAVALNNMIKNVVQFFSDVSNNASTVRESSESLASASEEMSASLEEVAASSQEFSSNAQTLSNNADVMGEMGKQTTSQAQQGNEAVEETVNNIFEISETIKNLKEVVSALGNRAKDISIIVETIKDFAEQTNLLALNASIEAARAGEHGKGFSVVAEEVSRLAEQSSKSASEITKLVTDIDTLVVGVSNKMAEGVVKVDKGTELVSRSSEVLKAIISTMSEMSDQIEKVQQASKEIGSGSEEVSTAVEEQTHTMIQISNAASQLQNLVNNLEESLTKFNF